MKRNGLLIGVQEASEYIGIGVEPCRLLMSTGYIRSIVVKTSLKTTHRACRKFVRRAMKPGFYLFVEDARETLEIATVACIEEDLLNPINDINMTYTNTRPQRKPNGNG